MTPRTEGYTGNPGRRVSEGGTTPSVPVYADHIPSGCVCSWGYTTQTPGNQWFLKFIHSACPAGHER